MEKGRKSTTADEKTAVEIYASQARFGGFVGYETSS